MAPPFLTISLKNISHSSSAPNELPLNRKLILQSQVPEDIQFAQSVSQNTGLELVLTKTSQDTINLIKAESAVVFLDASNQTMYQEFEAKVQEQIGIFSDQMHSCPIHFLSSLDLEGVPYLVKSPLFSFFITRTYGDPALAGKHYARIIHSSFGKKAFGLQTLLDPSAKIQVVKLVNSTQKQSAVDAVRSFLLAAKFQNRMASVIGNAVDELLMNAMFDAPIDEFGRQTYKLTPRSTALKLEGPSSVEMHVGFDGKYVGICVIDLFGSLDKGALLDHISKVYSKDEYKVKASQAGAGLGLSTVYRSGGSFFFVSESRARTEVTVFFKHTYSYREFKDQFRFLATQFYF